VSYLKECKLQNLIFQSDTTLILALLIGFVSLSTLITWIVIHPKNKNFIAQYEGIVAPFFSLPAVLFSLTAALLATSIWDNYSIATKAIKNESQGILNIISLADSIPIPKEIGLSEAAKTYTQSIIHDEWRTLSKSRSISPEAEEKFVAMRATTFKAANMLPDKAESKALLSAFNLVNSARETRLAYATIDVHPIRWYALLFLGVLVLITVAFTHSSKPKALMLAMLISTLTILTPLCIISLTFSNPYQGLISISNAPYLQIAK
jgi:hypothetical protein